ncbi:MAG: hypothetical protein U0T85_01320 [Cloacibacterium normanense]
MSVLLGKYIVSAGVGVGSSSLLLQPKTEVTLKKVEILKIFINWF